jgi:hypothetical protein
MSVQCYAIAFLITVWLTYKPLTKAQNWDQLAADTLSQPQSCTSADMLMCLLQQGWSVGPKSHPDVVAELLFPVTSCTDSHLHKWTPAVIKTYSLSIISTQKCFISAYHYIKILGAVTYLWNLCYNGISNTLCAGIQAMVWTTIRSLSGGGKIFLLSERSRMALRPTQPPIQWAI